MIENFTIEKKNIIEKLDNLYGKISTLEKELGLNNLKDIKNKIESSKSNIKNEVFSIAFFGAFSDGKSTLLSALTKSLNIKISPEPSTSTIDIYPYDDYLIIDTPGLFSDNILHDEKTKKYISEANVLIYTVDPVNPLKDSHHPTVKWILEDLDKQNSVIFVVNKMDEVADLEDEKDFQKHSEIKTQVVIDTLKSIIGNNQKPSIVCVAADPFTQGLEHWFKNQSEYRNLSKIGNLEKLLKNFVDRSKDELIIKCGDSIIKDSIDFVINDLDNLKTQIEVELENTHSQVEDLDTKLDQFNKEAKRNYNSIRSEVINLRDEIITYINSSIDITDLRTRVESRVGTDGYLINEKINNIISKHIDDLLESQERLISDLENSLNFHSRNQESILNALSRTGSLLGEFILGKSKEEIITFVKEIGTMLGKKTTWFKGTGKWTSQWAGRLTMFGQVLKALPALTESLTLVISIYNESKFEKERTKVKGEIDKLFKDFLEDLTFEAFIKEYFSDYLKIQEKKVVFSDLENNYKQVLTNINKAYKEMSNIKLN